jgi:hypothetical protein
MGLLLLAGNMLTIGIISTLIGKEMNGKVGKFAVAV